MGRENHSDLPLTSGLWESLESGEVTRGEAHRTRDRIRHTIINGWRLWGDLPADERQKLFDVEAKGPDSGSKLENRLRSDYKQFHDGLKWWLAFLYAGIEGAPHAYEPGLGTVIAEYDDEGNPSMVRHPTARFDFEYLLREAIEQVANSQGERVTKFDLTVETEPLEPPQPESFDTEKLLERFEEGAFLSVGEQHHLRREVDLTKEEWDQYYDRLDAQRGSHRPDGVKGGWGGRGIDEMLQQEREEPTSEDTSDE